MVIIERLDDDARPKGTGRVNGTAGVVNAKQLSDEERQAYADWSNERRSMLFGSEHENGEDQLRGEEHLDEQPLDVRDSVSKRHANIDSSREKGIDHGGG